MIENKARTEEELLKLVEELVDAQNEGIAWTPILNRVLNQARKEGRLDRFDEEMLYKIREEARKEGAEEAGNKEFKAIKLLRHWTKWWNGPGRENFHYPIIPPITKTAKLLTCIICAGADQEKEFDYCRVCGREKNE